MPGEVSCCRGDATVAPKVGVLDALGVRVAGERVEPCAAGAPADPRTTDAAARPGDTIACR